jgi:hypothetical protein
MTSTWKYVLAWKYVGRPGVWSGAMLIAVTTAALAHQPPLAPRTGALAPGGTGLVAGRVIDPASGAGVPSAIVWFQIDVVLRPDSPRVMTDADGRFVFVNVPAGRYILHAQKFGYSRGYFGQKDVMDPGTELDVADKQIMSDVAVPIWKHAAIGGTVTDEAGEPVVGVSVRAFRKIVTFGEIRFTSGYQGSAGTTDDRGAFRLSSLLPGEYLVAAPSQLTTFPAEIMPDLLGSEMTSVASGAISELAPLGSPRNQQVGGSVIMATNRTPIPPASAAGVVGVYRTTLFAAATKLGDATTFTLMPGEERSGVDISLRPVRAASVSGQIVGPDGATGPTVVRLLPAGDAMLSASREFDVATGLSDAAGRFTLLGVPEGQYLLWVERPVPPPGGQPSDSRAQLYGVEPVTVSSAGLRDVLVTLRPKPRVTIRLDMRDGRTIRSGDLALLIEPVGAGGRAELVPDSSKPAVASLPSGRYVITPYLGQSSCAALFQGRDVSDEPIELATEDVEVTVVCGGQPTRLTGSVRNDRGAADSDALVVVFPADRRFWSGAGLRVRRKASAQTTASGTFAITNLPPGDYFVAALPIGGSDFWQDPRVLEGLSAAATRVSLAQGESRAVDVRTGRIR